MQKTVPIALVATAVIAVPVIAFAGHTLLASSATATASTSTSTVTQTSAPLGPALPVVNTGKSPARTYVGPSVDMDWGPVQVTIVVKGLAVTDVSATAPTERARSAYINQQAVPMLRQEVLQAKTAAKIKGIYGISGATLTSEAFYQSLLAALHTAHLT